MTSLSPTSLQYALLPENPPMDLASIVKETQDLAEKVVQAKTEYQEILKRYNDLAGDPRPRRDFTEVVTQSLQTIEHLEKSHSDFQTQSSTLLRKFSLLHSSSDTNPPNPEQSELCKTNMLRIAKEQAFYAQLPALKAKLTKVINDIIDSTNAPSPKVAPPQEKEENPCCCTLQ